MIKGLIIEKDPNKADTIKILLENKDVELNAKVDIIGKIDKNFCLMDIRNYDFLMTQVKSINEREFRREIVPYLKAITEKKRNVMRLDVLKKIVYIDKSDILGLEVMGKLCYIHTCFNGPYVVGRISLCRLLEMIDDPSIVRCHRSYAVNVNYIRSFHRENRYRWKPVFVVKTDFECRTTDKYMDEVLRKIEEVQGVKIRNSFGV